jgi:hypothetical protein
MSVIGLRIGPYEIAAPATVPEAGDWFTATRVGALSRESGGGAPRESGDALLHLLPSDAPAEARAQSARAFEVLRGVNDPRIPAPLGWYEGSGALAFPALSGVGLDELWPYRRSGQVPMPPATILDFGVELADILVRAHNRNLVHGRLDASRIWIGTDGRLSVWGFALNPATPADPLWIAPERARGEPATPATDQWSLGMVLAGLILAEAPWSTATGNPLDAARRGNVDAVLTRIDGQWPAFARLLRRMTESMPDQRFPWMHNVRQELSDLSRAVGGTSLRRAIGSRLVRAVATEAAERAQATESPAAAAPEREHEESETGAAETGAAESFEEADRSPTLVAVDVEEAPDEEKVESDDPAIVNASPAAPSDTASGVIAPGATASVATATVEFDEEDESAPFGADSDPESARTEQAAPARGSAPNLTLPEFSDDDPPSATGIIVATRDPSDRASAPGSWPLWPSQASAGDAPSVPVFDPVAAQRQVDTTRQDLPSIPATSHSPMSHELPSWPAFPTGARNEPVLAELDEPPSVHIPPPDNALVKRVAPWLAGFMLVSLAGLLLWQLSG